MSFIEVTTPNGRKLDIRPDLIQAIQTDINDLYADGTNCVIEFVNGKHQAIKETKEEVRSLIKASQTE